MSFRSTLYVGNVAYSSTEADFAIFTQYGNVLSVDIKRGFAFVKYDTQESAQAAIEGANNLLFNGRNIRVNFSNSEPHPKRQTLSPNLAPIQTNNSLQWQPPRVPYKENSIHLANLPHHAKEEILQHEFEEFGVVSVHIIQNSRVCFAIIELSSLENARKAIELKKSFYYDYNEVIISKQLEIPERHNNRSGRGGREGYRRGRRGSFRQFDQMFHLNHLNNNANNNLNTNINPNPIQINAYNDINENIEVSNNYVQHQSGGYRSRGDIFRGRGSFGGRGHYRSRGQYRSRGRGGYRGRARNIDVLTHNNNFNNGNSNGIHINHNVYPTN